jgi:hypothetical protein
MIKTKLPITKFLSKRHKINATFVTNNANMVSKSNVEDVKNLFTKNV